MVPHQGTGQLFEEQQPQSGRRGKFHLTVYDSVALWHGRPLATTVDVGR